MRIERARIVWPGCHELTPDETRELEQMLDLGDAKAQRIKGHDWATHTVGDRCGDRTWAVKEAEG